jgi:transcriptional repressor NrdR
MDGTSIRRRRECIKCTFRFTSYEHIEEKPLMIIKRDGRREVFDLSKMERGIQRSLEKRPVSQPAVEKLIREIANEAAMLGKSTNEVSSEELGELVLKKLFQIDRVAYVRFASVYKMFNNLDEFIKEIEMLSKNSEKKQISGEGA